MLVLLILLGLFVALWIYDHTVTRTVLKECYYNYFIPEAVVDEVRKLCQKK